MDRKDYLEYRAQTLQSATDQIGKYGRALLFLSSGAIALSLAFFDSIARPGQIHWVYALILSWSSFALSLFFVLLSEYAGFKAAHFNVKQADKNYELSEDTWRVTKWNPCVEWSNVTAGLTFWMGAVALMLFAYRNLGS